MQIPKKRMIGWLFLAWMCISLYLASTQIKMGFAQSGAPKILEGSVFMMIGPENLTSNEVYFENTINIYFTPDRPLISVNIFLVKQNSPNLFPYRISLYELETSGRYKATVNLKTIKDSAYGTGTYDLFINMTDNSNQVGNYTQTGFLIITDEKPQTGGGITLDIDWRIIVIVVVGIAILSIIPMMIKKQKMKKTLSEIDQSIEKIDEKDVKKSKRRERVVGASAIGKMSGLEAELKHSKEEEPKAEPKISERKSLVKERLKEPSVKTVDLDQKSKTSSKAPETEEDIAALLTTKSPSTMQIKMQEKGLDLDRKAAFLESKINSLNQNLVLSKMILEQTNQALKKQKDCPQCGYRFPIDEPRCPNCVITNQDPNLLDTKLQNAKPIGNKSLCLICKKIVEPEWSECPYCLANSKK